MPNFGLSKPWIANYHPTTNTYSGAFKCGKAVNTSVTPNYNETPFYADNEQTENVVEFKNGTLTLGVDRMPIQAPKVMFGHSVSDDGEEVSKADDSASYCGYGFITAEMLDGVKKFRACVLHKVQFKEGEEVYETKGDSIVFKNPSLSGAIMSNAEGEWRTKSPYFDTEAEADNWIQIKLGVVEQCAIPTASVASGTYDSTQSVVLSTTTTGAKIKYTTDGTTPSSENGTEYKSAISVATTTGLRAIAFKAGAEDSPVMVKEYFIVTQ